MHAQLPPTYHQWKALHLFCGSGGAALGTQRAHVSWRDMEGSFRTLTGIDVDPKACQNFEYLTGEKAVCMDLFERRDYVAFHGHEPAADWHEAVPEDLIRATSGEYPDYVFLSPPCKGFSALLPQKTAETDRYQALNRLVVRGIFLTLEAFKDDLPAFFFLENVPRILSRGKKLLHTIIKMLESYGYVVSGRPHDLGEIAGLGQHRKRYLLVARNPQKISTFLYQPPKQRVKSIGEILTKVPLPDDPAAGPLHRLPRLQWKTWVRLALIPAGGDWRDLEGIQPEQYRLEYVPRGRGPWGVQNWNQPSKTIIGNTNINGSNGAAVIADPRTGFKDSTHHAIYQVDSWDAPAKTVTGANRPNNGAISISDPRIVCSPQSGVLGVQSWNEPAGTVIGAADVHAGAVAVSDPRIPRDDDRPDPPPVIISQDGTRHRPLTTLELAAIQGLPLTVQGKPLQLAGNSNAGWREQIGNMVPPDAARVMAEQALYAFLASVERTWTMDAEAIWVAPRKDPADTEILPAWRMFTKNQVQTPHGVF